MAARSDSVVDTLSLAAGPSLLAGSREVMLRRRVGAQHAQIERLIAEADRLRHQPTPTLSMQLRAALLAFHSDAAALLGLNDDDNERDDDDA